VVIQELVEAWSGMRASLLEAVAAVRRDVSEGDKRDKVHKDQKSAKRGRVDDAETDDGRSSRRRLRSSRSNASYAETPMELAGEAPRVDLKADDDYNPDPSPPPVDQTAAQGLVACPCCGVRMKNELVYTHLDRCEGLKPPAASPKPKSMTAAPRAPAPPPQYLPFLSYQLLNEKALRGKLAALCLPTTGGKPAMQRRHEYYVNLFNANCDSDSPRSARALLRDLDAWERTMATGPVGAHALAMRGDGAPQVGAEVMKKDFDGRRWADAHEGQFKDLVAEARARARGADAAKKPGGQEEEPERVDAPAEDQAGVDAVLDFDDEFGAFIPDSEEDGG
jgi:E3 ubiquitin-protein ligase RAD18